MPLSVLNVLRFSIVASAAALVAACGGGGGGGGSALPQITPTAFPTVLPSTQPLGTTCLTPGQSVGRSVSALSEARMMPQAARNEYVPDQLAVQYRTSTLNAARSLQSVIPGGRADVVTDSAFPGKDLTMRVVRVNPQNIESAASALRAQSGVLRVDRVPYKYEMTASRVLTKDPYFAQNVAPPSNPPGYPSGPPYYETATIPGQWDMHAINLDFAFGYAAAATNTIGVARPAALGGSSSVKLAIIDTGADLSHPDLSGARVVRTECFITPTAGPTTSTTDVSDFDGHGTNVAGIAAASLNNGYFVGVAGNVSLMIYRIFPVGANATASGADEVLAINDAVKAGANVISMSLGSATADPNEAAAVNNAILNGVTVVAASGNEALKQTTPALDYPAGYPGVIAVGASALDDTNPASITEKIAGYSNYQGGSTSWGLVAPGGDPTGNTDNDDLHWIENAYSTRAIAPNACTPSVDFYGEPASCKTLIAGTSQATPHVAGAAALLISVHGGAMSPTVVKNAILNSAHDIGQGAKQGAGRLNVYKLIANELGDSSVPQ